MVREKLCFWIHFIVLWNVLQLKAEIDCGWPETFYNGYIIGSKTIAGSTIFFSCNTHTSFEGRSFSSICLSTGKWSYKPPTCWGQCQVPVITSATVVGLQEFVYVNHNTEVQYQCDSGLVPRDSPNMKCDNGTWSGSVECVPAPCPSAPPHVHNGIRIYMGQEHGCMAKYECFAGFQLTGMNGTYMTCEFGVWKGGRPQCLEFVASKDVSELKDSSQQPPNVEHDVQPHSDNSTDGPNRKFDGSSSANGTNDTGSVPQGTTPDSSEREVDETVSDKENCSAQNIQLEFNKEIEDGLKIIAQIGDTRMQQLVYTLIKKIHDRNKVLLIRTADSSPKTPGNDGSDNEHEKA